MDRHELLACIRKLNGPLMPQPTGEKPSLPEWSASVRAVIFDFYGTLFISASGDIGVDGGQPAALVEALAAVGLSLRPAAVATAIACLRDYADAVLKTHEVLKHAGIEYPEADIRDIWSHLAKEWKAEGRLEGAWNRKTIDRLAVEYEGRANPVWPMPGLTDVLDMLAQRKIKTGLLSNAQFYTPLTFEALLDRPFVKAGFDPKLTVFSFEEREAKPGRRMFEKLLEAGKREYAFAPECVVYVGNDMLKDIVPAKALGMKTLLFAGDRRSFRRRADRPACRAVQPDGILTDLRQLVDVLK